LRDALVDLSTTSDVVDLEGLERALARFFAQRLADGLDQADFGHEFRAFTGLTPTRYVEVRRQFLREHPGHALDGWPLPAD
jgi:hypothetical protein